MSATPPTSTAASGSTARSLPGPSWRGWYRVVIRLWAQGSLGEAPADLALSSELACPTSPLPREPRVCGLAGLSHLLSEPLWLLPSPLPVTGHCPVLLPSRGLAPEARQARAGGHGVHLAPTCNRGALVFVSCSLARAPQMSGVARLFPCPSSLHGRVQPGLAPSPLGREEGSTRAQAPPQPRTRPWPGHEHWPCLVNRRPGPSAAGSSPLPTPGSGAQASAPGH